MQAKALVETLVHNLPDAEADTHWDKFGDVKAEALADPLAVTLAEGGAETLNDKLIKV